MSPIFSQGRRRRHGDAVKTWLVELVHQQPGVEQVIHWTKLERTSFFKIISRFYFEKAFIVLCAVSIKTLASLNSSVFSNQWKPVKRGESGLRKMSLRAVEPRDYALMMFSTFTNEKKRHLKSQGKKKKGKRLLIQAF